MVFNYFKSSACLFSFMWYGSHIANIILMLVTYNNHPIIINSYKKSVPGNKIYLHQVLLLYSFLCTGMRLLTINKTNTPFDVLRSDTHAKKSLQEQYHLNEESVHKENTVAYVEHPHIDQATSEGKQNDNNGHVVNGDFVKDCNVKESVHKHTVEQTYQCSDCNKTFSAMNTLQTHILRSGVWKSHKEIAIWRKLEVHPQVSLIGYFRLFVWSQKLERGHFDY